MANGHVKTGPCSATQIKITTFKYKRIVRYDLYINNRKCLITVVIMDKCSSSMFQLAT